MENNISRRSFLQKSLVGTAGLLSLPLLSGFKSSPNDTIRLGFIGLGRQAMFLMNEFRAIDGVKIVAGADVYGIKRKRFEHRMRKYYYEQGMNSDITTYENYKDLLERKDIDAVVNATPDHWHALTTIDACNAGKDVYLEKPLTFTIKEGEKVIHAVRRNGRILAVGSQQRSDSNFRHAVRMVRKEAIGQLQKIDINIGDFPEPYDLPIEPVPADLNWELWLGPNPYVHYNHELAPPISLDPPKDESLWGAWRWYKETGGGHITDWGAHHFDIGQWAIGKGGPVKTIPPGYNGTEHLTYVYDNGVEMIKSGKGKGVRFQGSDGWIEVARGFIDASDKALLPSNKKEKEGDQPYEMSLSHRENFIYALRNRKDPVVPVETGHRTCTTCLLGLISYELGRPVEWDPHKQYFVNDPEAEKYYHREYRHGYRL
ncbi:MAG: Gfo/Idh/MocA family oxidoreductase [Bacteroidales bacterium]|nr:Gfo/Idh/MocA family oxidoreductase [Bacteroidales bacterium]MBS3774217.1 Gfo/Idh/MocA family oxidoreductase [Bacteroidales bacterium]